MYGGRRSKYRVGIYARVSTDDQHPENQIQRLREVCDHRGWEVVGEYMDVISGAEESRPELDRMIKDARLGRMDAVLVTKIDRLGRSLVHFLQLTQELQRLGVDIIAIDQEIDTGGPTGRLIWAILGAIAEFERELIRERTKEGLERAKREGKRIGRPPIPEEVKRKVIRMREAGMSYGAIARELKISKRSVIRIVQGAKTPPTPTK